MKFAKDAGIAIGVFLLGLVILVLGVWFVVSQTQSGRKAVSVATRGAVK